MHNECVQGVTCLKEILLFDRCADCMHVCMQSTSSSQEVVSCVEMAHFLFKPTQTDTQVTAVMAVAYKGQHHHAFQNTSFSVNPHTSSVLA